MLTLACITARFLVHAIKPSVNSNIYIISLLVNCLAIEWIITKELRFADTCMQKLNQKFYAKINCVVFSGLSWNQLSIISYPLICNLYIVLNLRLIAQHISFPLAELALWKYVRGMGNWSSQQFSEVCFFHYKNCTGSIHEKWTAWQGVFC